MNNKQWSIPPTMQIDPKKSYQATIETNRGTIQIQFDHQNAPKTVNNFAFLAREGFYDGITFHRVISNFMIQGGDPTGTGRAAPVTSSKTKSKATPDSRYMCNFNGQCGFEHQWQSVLYYALASAAPQRQAHSFW